MEAWNQSDNDNESTPDAGVDLAFVERRLWQIFAPIIIVVGLLGNLLVVIVFSRLHFSKSSTLVHMFVLAITDSVILCLGPTRRWAIHTYDFDIRDISDGGCKLHLFLLYTSLDFSAWILVSVTLERALSVLKPLHVRGWFTVRKTVVRLSVILVVIFLINGHYFFSNGITNGLDSENGTTPAYLSPEPAKYSAADRASTTSILTASAAGNSSSGGLLDGEVVTFLSFSSITAVSNTAKTLTGHTALSAGAAALNSPFYSSSAGSGANIVEKKMVPNKKGLYIGTTPSETYSCDSLTHEWEDFEEYVFVYIDICVESFVPFVIMAVCNTFIVASLRKASRNRPRGTTRRELQSLAGVVDSVTRSSRLVSAHASSSGSRARWKLPLPGSRSSGQPLELRVSAAAAPAPSSGTSTRPSREPAGPESSSEPRATLTDAESPRTAGAATGPPSRHENPAPLENGHAHAVGSHLANNGHPNPHPFQYSNGASRAPAPAGGGESEGGPASEAARKGLSLWRRKVTSSQQTVAAPASPAAILLHPQGRPRLPDVAEGSSLSSGVTRMLVIVTTVFLLSTLPAGTYFIVDSYVRDKTDTADEESVNKRLNLTLAVTNLLQYANYGCNFLLYSLHSKRFLREVKFMFGLVNGRFRRPFNSSVLSRGTHPDSASRSRLSALRRNPPSSRERRTSLARGPPLPCVSEVEQEEPKAETSPGNGRASAGVKAPNGRVLADGGEQKRGGSTESTSFSWSASASADPRELPTASLSDRSPSAESGTSDEDFTQNDAVMEWNRRSSSSTTHSGDRLVSNLFLACEAGDHVTYSNAARQKTAGSVEAGKDRPSREKQYPPSRKLLSEADPIYDSDAKNLFKGKAKLRRLSVQGDTFLATANLYAMCRDSQFQPLENGERASMETERGCADSDSGDDVIAGFQSLNVELQGVHANTRPLQNSITRILHTQTEPEAERASENQKTNNTFSKILKAFSPNGMKHLAKRRKECACFQHNDVLLLDRVDSVSELVATAGDNQPCPSCRTCSQSTTLATQANVDGRSQANVDGRSQANVDGRSQANVDGRLAANGVVCVRF